MLARKLLSFAHSAVRVSSTISSEVLRDHCRCPTCYSAATCQRHLELRNFKTDVRPVRIVTKENGDMTINWSDGHFSVYTKRQLDELVRRDHGKDLPDKIPWAGDSLPAKHDAQGILAEILSNGAHASPKLAEFIRDLVQFGIGVVTNIEPNAEKIEDFVSNIALIKETFYGKFWEFTAEENLSHADTAFTNLGIGPHTDSTYLSQTPGLQVNFVRMRFCRLG